MAALITTATNRKPYFVGKPNPIMIRAGLNRIGVHSETTAFIGDRMDTDMRSGLEAGLQTHLVLSGSTALEDVSTYPFRPVAIHEGIGGVVPLVS
ncbi:Dihydroxyacetone phosphatase [bioreactor metagenome]|uniref:Dihydroxyacetone phosphatase n=1 Tax=bioreactor metagenome TaxID=1076179 RepID=A0A644Z1U4_9ZZZZ